jgi:hypothetical protein
MIQLRRLILFPIAKHSVVRQAHLPGTRSRVREKQIPACRDKRRCTNAGMTGKMRKNHSVESRKKFCGYLPDLVLRQYRLPFARDDFIAELD